MLACLVHGHALHVQQQDGRFLGLGGDTFPRENLGLDAEVFKLGHQGAPVRGQLADQPDGMGRSQFCRDAGFVVCPSMGDRAAVVVNEPVHPCGQALNLAVQIVQNVLWNLLFVGFLKQGKRLLLQAV